ncbi:MAG: discoidin domain-containing protein [Coprococcus sp.]
MRYLPRNGNNGDVTEYKVQYRATDDGKWEDLASGTWDNPTTRWKLVTFPAVEAKQVRLIGVHTIAEAGREFAYDNSEFRCCFRKK